MNTCIEDREGSLILQQDLNICRGEDCTVGTKQIADILYEKLNISDLPYLFKV